MLEVFLFDVTTSVYTVFGKVIGNDIVAPLEDVLTPHCLFAYRNVLSLETIDSSGNFCYRCSHIPVI